MKRFETFYEMAEETKLLTLYFFQWTSLMEKYCEQRFDFFLRTNESIDADQVRGYATNHGQYLKGLFGIILGFSVPHGF